MIVLALDVSLTSTGYCLWSYDDNETISVGAIRTTSRGLDRYSEIIRAVRKIGRTFGKVDLVVFEGFPFFLIGFAKQRGGGPARGYRSEEGHGPGNQIFGLAGVTEMIKMMVHYEWQVPFACLAPSSIKKYATGFGRCGKPEMIAQLKDEHGLSFKTDDEVDAWYIAQLSSAILEFTINENLPEEPHRKETIKAIVRTNNPEGTFDWVNVKFFDQPFGRKKLYRRKRRGKKHHASQVKRYQDTDGYD